MKTASGLIYVLSVGATLGVLTACGASQQPLGQTGGMPPSVPGHAAHGGSGASPEAKSDDLLYAIGSQNVVYAFTYPGGKPVETLTGLDSPSGLCSDKNGNVWIVNSGSREIVEYAHGGKTPIKTLSDPNFSPGWCSVDPTTGNLAAVGSDESSAAIAVYVGAQRSPLVYSVPFETASYCGYDNKGNLFVDGYSHNSVTTGFGELRKGATKFKRLEMRDHFATPGGVQWDGKYITLGGSYADAPDIYRFDIRGDRAVQISSHRLNDLHFLNAFWIQGSRVVATDLFGQGPYKTLYFYAYPAGDNPVKTVEDYAAGYPSSLTVSVAPKQSRRLSEPDSSRSFLPPVKDEERLSAPNHSTH